MYDLVINNGFIVDGMGTKRFKANIAINMGIIEAITCETTLRGKKIVDANNFIVAPGFIDIHSHADWVFPQNDHAQVLEPFLLQGVTTCVGGNCGFTPFPITETAKPLVNKNSSIFFRLPFEYHWLSTKEYLDFLEKKGVFLNLAVLVGHNTLRTVVKGNNSQKLAEYELDRIAHLTSNSIQDGAFGLSMGLAYIPGIFADDQEIYTLIEETSKSNGIWAFHGHTYSWTSPFYKPRYIGKPHNLRDLIHLIELAGKASCKANISHLLFKGRYTWKTYKEALSIIERAAENGMDIAFDAIPYHWGNSQINLLFPKWFLDGFTDNIRNKRKIRKVKRTVQLSEKLIGRNFKDLYLLWGGADSLNKFEGLSFSEIAEEINSKPIDAFIHVARESEGRARILTSSYSGEEGSNDKPLFEVLSHPLCSFGLDSMLTDIQVAQNPASYGGFPRILGRLCRDLKLFSLENAIKRMTSFSAQRIGIKGVGRIARGYCADIVVLNEETINDNTTLKTPNAKPSGIEAVIISGEIVVENGRIVSYEKYGRVLKKR